jgi:uncharacterized delta-60 repeat protein
VERRNQLPEGLEQWLNKIAPPDPGRRKPALTRFNENGSPDLVFGNKILPGTDTIVGLSGCLQADAKILLLVSSSVKAGDKKTVLYRLLPDGDFDLEFGGQGFIDVRFDDQLSQGQAVAISADGKILVGGNVERKDPDQLSAAVARYFPDGRLDPSFGRSGMWESEKDRTIHNMIVDQDGVTGVGHYLLAGEGYVASISRLTPDGACSPTFNKGKSLNIDVPADVPRYFVSCESVLVQSDKSIVVGGWVGFETWAFWLRILPDGTPDPAFGSQGIVVHDRPSVLFNLHLQNDQQRVLAAVVDTRRPYVLGIRL